LHRIVPIRRLDAAMPLVTLGADASAGRRSDLLMVRLNLCCFI
jgi:hypothetical protein